MIKFLVDSSSDYSQEEIKEKQLEYIPISVTLGDTTYLDGVELERNHFYKMLGELTSFPKTSQPSPQVFLDAFEKAKDNSDDLICILLSSSLSGTCQSAYLAKDMVDYDRIHIIDSASASYGIKIMTDYGIHLRENGLNAQEIVLSIEALKPRIRIIAGVDTLEYLYKGGRLNKATATIGELANLKPIITVKEDGSVGVPGKCIGRNKALQYIVKYIQEHTMDTLFPLYTLYTYHTENTEKLEEKLTAAGYTIDARLQIGSSIGAHVGHGAFGIFYVEK